MTPILTFILNIQTHHFKMTCHILNTLATYKHILFKTSCSCPRSIAGVPFDLAGRFRATLLLRTTCMRSCCTWIASCGGTTNQKPKTIILTCFPARQVLCTVTFLIQLFEVYISKLPFLEVFFIITFFPASEDLGAFLIQLFEMYISIPCRVWADWSAGRGST